MLAKEDVTIDEERQEKVPEVEVVGEVAIIRLDTPEGIIEERQVKLPRTTWA